MKLIQKSIDLDRKRRIFTVGDVHGEYTRFMKQLHDTGFDPDLDAVVAVGDLIDRGPENVQCLELLLQPWFHSVVGNHELMMLDSIIGPGNSIDIWAMNGGIWYFQMAPEDQEHVKQLCHKYVSGMPTMLSIGFRGKTIGFVHADPPGDWNDVKDWGRIERLVWGRSQIKRAIYGDLNIVTGGVDHVYCGHTPQDKVLRSGNITWIDTGACFGGELTILDIAEDLGLSKEEKKDEL